MTSRQKRRERPPLTRHFDSRPVRLIVSNDGEDVGEIILPAPKGIEPTRYRVS